MECKMMSALRRMRAEVMPELVWRALVQADCVFKEWRARLLHKE